jgi:hypothetical protein
VVGFFTLLGFVMPLHLFVLMPSKLTNYIYRVSLLTLVVFMAITATSFPYSSTPMWYDGTA